MSRLTFRFNAGCVTLQASAARVKFSVFDRALTRAIQRLEEELGGALLYRERSLTQLTELGKVMLPHLEAAFVAAQTASAQAAAFRRRADAPLHLGLNPTISARILMPVLRELGDRIDAFELTLVEGISDALFVKMLDGDLDAAVVAEPDKLPERINRWLLFEDRYVVLCEPGHRFAQLGEVSASTLAEERLLLRSQDGSDFDRLLARLPLAADSQRSTRHRGGNEDHVEQMVAAGLGVAVSAASQPVAPGIAVVPLADPDAIRPIIVTAVAGRPHSPCLATFLKLMRARDWRSATEDSRSAAALSEASKP